jgi:hypothetical protein
MEFEVCQNSLYANHIGRSANGKVAIHRLRALVGGSPFDEMRRSGGGSGIGM